MSINGKSVNEIIRLQREVDQMSISIRKAVQAIDSLDGDAKHKLNQAYSDYGSITLNLNGAANMLLDYKQMLAEILDNTTVTWPATTK